VENIPRSFGESPKSCGVEGALTISIEQNDLPNQELRQRVVDTIRDCLGDRPPDENWKISIRNVAGHYEITVKGPLQTRQKFFFDVTPTLPAIVRAWLESYPLK
jgi:hypothetical protein